MPDAPIQRRQFQQIAETIERLIRQLDQITPNLPAHHRPKIQAYLEANLNLRGYLAALQPIQAASEALPDNPAPQQAPGVIEPFPGPSSEVARETPATDSQDPEPSH